MMTRVLAFDTSGPWSSVCITRDEEIIAHESHYLPRAHSSELLPLIQKTMKKANYTFYDFDRIATIIGPGSFTGLRVGIATAQGISFALDKPLIGIDAFKAYANALDTSDDTLIVLDTQKEDVYCQLLNSNCESVKEPVALQPNQVAEYAGDILYNLIGDGVQKVRPLLEELGKSFETHEISADQVCQSLARLASKASSLEINNEKPLYIHSVKVTKPNK